MLTVEGDRRGSPRIALRQPCKIHDPRTGKYIAGITRDLSSGGAMIEVPRLLPLKCGDTLYIGVAMKRRQGLLRSNEMLRANVTRTVQTVDDRTLLGLQFERSQIESEQAALRIAA